MSFINKCKHFLCEHGLRERPKISILIPFSSKDKKRTDHFHWLLKYLRHELPHAEIVIGKSKSKVFCKGEALNHAFNRSSGRIIVVLDADAYIEGHIIERCANRILESLYYGHRLWFVPYRHLYRLTEKITEAVVHSNPACPLRIPTPPPVAWIENNRDSATYGSRYGAMITIFPRQAIEKIKCFDQYFSGWGGEDIALLRALDTLYGKHKTTHNAVFHLWHPFHGHTYKERRWDGQENPNSNSERANRYNSATRHPAKMTALINEAWEYYLRRK